MGSLEENIWIVVDEDRYMWASLSQIWGKELRTMAEYATNPNYGSLLELRVEKDGLDKVAHRINANIGTINEKA